MKLQRLVEQVVKGFENYEFHSVYTHIHHFCTVFLSQFYLDVLKDRLYILPQGDEKRRSSQTVMYEILLGLVRMVHLILPHTTEEVWKFIPGVREESVLLTDFPQVETDIPTQARKQVGCAGGVAGCGAEGFGRGEK